MDQNTSGAVLLLILAAAGFIQHQPAVWMLAGLTAGLAFLTVELRGLGMTNLAFNTALASWATVAVAALILLI
jgi:hypothetical protein